MPLPACASWPLHIQAWSDCAVHWYYDPQTLCTIAQSKLCLPRRDSRVRVRKTYSQSGAAKLPGELGCRVVRKFSAHSACPTVWLSLCVGQVKVFMSDLDGYLQLSCKCLVELRNFLFNRAPERPWPCHLLVGLGSKESMPYQSLTKAILPGLWAQTGSNLMPS